MSRGWIKHLLVLSAALCLAACASTGSKREGGGSAGSADVPGHVLSKYNKALYAMQEGKDEQAAERLEDFIDEYPSYAGPYVNLGIIHARSEREDEARDMFEQAIEVNPDYAPAYNELGILNRKQGRFDEAVAAYQAAIKVDPAYALAYLNLGVLYDLYQQNPQLALESYQQYLELEDDEAVERWIAELEMRIAVAQRSARAGDIEQ